MLVGVGRRDSGLPSGFCRAVSVYSSHVDVSPFRACCLSLLAMRSICSLPIPPSDKYKVSLFSTDFQCDGACWLLLRGLPWLSLWLSFTNFTGTFPLLTQAIS